MVNKKSKARFILLGVALIFIIPIFVSWYLVFFTDFKKEDGGTQKGEIISPVISLGELEVFRYQERFCFINKRQMDFSLFS